MVIELFLLFQILMLVAFTWGFLGKNEIVWTISAFLAGLLAFMSFNVETWVYVWDASIQAYVPTLMNNSYIWLSGINILFFVLSLVLGVYDLYEKLQSGKKFLNMRENEN